MRPTRIKHSLYRPPTWMGMPRVSGIVWVLICGFEGALAGLHAKSLFWASVVSIIAIIGIYTLRKIAERDSAFFKVLWLRKDYDDIYPAYVTLKDRNHG